MKKFTLTPQQILAAMEAAGMQIDHETYNKAVAAAAKKLSDEIDAELYKKLVASIPKEYYESIDSDEAMALWEKLKLLQPYDGGSSLHVVEERYELNGVKYIAYWEIWGPSDIPEICIIKERK
jgi:hypothetical protein